MGTGDESLPFVWSPRRLRRPFYYASDEQPWGPKIVRAPRPYPLREFGGLLFDGRLRRDEAERATRIELAGAWLEAKCSTMEQRPHVTWSG